MEENVQYNPYRINVGDTIEVKRQDVNWKDKKLTFYKTYIKIGEQEYYKLLRFRKEISLDDGTYIRLNNFFETARHADKFRDEWSLMILDFDIVDKPSDAIKEYQDNVYEYDNDILF